MTTTQSRGLLHFTMRHDGGIGTGTLARDILGSWESVLLESYVVVPPLLFLVLFECHKARSDEGNDEEGLEEEAEPRLGRFLTRDVLCLARPRIRGISGLEYISAVDIDELNGSVLKESHIVKNK